MHHRRTYRAYAEEISILGVIMEVPNCVGLYGNMVFDDIEECNHVMKHLKNKPEYITTTGMKKFEASPLDFDFGLFSDLMTIAISYRNDKFFDHADSVVKIVDRYRKAQGKKYSEEADD